MTVADPFHTAALRETVLTAWAASPARFREDANAEERLSIGYGDRAVAELAANAADAARRAGMPGAVTISLIGRELRVANTGAPLDAAGVASLASLRASAKRERQSVGHFGVGFAAVRAISDELTVASQDGAVRFATSDTVAAVAGLGDAALTAELERRAGRVPALRLPWWVPIRAGRAHDAAHDAAHDGAHDAAHDAAAASTPVAVDPPPPDMATEVRLVLRDADTVAAVASRLDTGVAEDLLWALPDLTTVIVNGIITERGTVPDRGFGYVTLRRRGDGPPAQRQAAVMAAGGHVPVELLSDRAVEEQERDRWHVVWAMPIGAGSVEVGGDSGAIGVDRNAGRVLDGIDGVGRTVVGAPTPTAEPLGLPARLVGTLPVDESREHITPGPLTDFLVARAAEAYCDLVESLPASRRPAAIPEPGFPAGEFDAAMRGAITASLARTEFLADAADRPVSPHDAVLVAGLVGPAARHAAEAVPGLLDYPTRLDEVGRLRGLGVRIEGVATVTAGLAQLQRPREFWQALYDGLSDIPRAELVDLPVPAAGGGMLMGPHTVLVGPPTTVDDTDGYGLDRAVADAAELVPGLRVAAFDHPLLRRLGARSADPDTVLAEPELGAEIRRRAAEFDAVERLDEIDVDDLRSFATVILGLVDAGIGADAARIPALAEVLLTDESGDPCPAGEMLLPDAMLAGVLAADVDLPTVGAEWLDRYDARLLESLGVRDGFGVRWISLPPRQADDLPEIDAWWDELATDPAVAVALADPGDTDGAAMTVPVVTDLDLVDGEHWPVARQMLTADRAVAEALRPVAGAASYTTWWLRRHTDLGDAPAVVPAADTADPVIDTELTRMAGLSVPIVCAPMAGVGDARLARAVGAAGGLGCVGIGSTRTPEWVEAQLGDLADAGVPFGVGLMAWSIPADPTVFEMVLAARPTLLSISLGGLDPWVAQARDAGIVVAVQVGTVDEAIAAQRAGASIVVARGAEGGGHGRNAVATMPLLQSVLDAVDVPVLAAGGISGPRGLAAALAAGAAGAWAGTAFAGCLEATSTSAARRAMARAAATDTVYGNVFDIVQRLAWPAEFGGRSLTNAFTNEWIGYEAELRARVADQDASSGITAEMARARADGDVHLAPVYCGQGVGAIRTGRPAAEIVADFASAGRLLRSAATGVSVRDR